MQTSEGFPVLQAILARTALPDTEVFRMTPSDLARATGLPRDRVLAILDVNVSVLDMTASGQLTGVRILAAASERGMVIQRRDLPKGNSRFRRYFLKGQEIGAVNLDSPRSKTELALLEASLLAKGIPICGNLSDMPERVVRAIWSENVA